MNQSEADQMRAEILAEMRDDGWRNLDIRMNADPKNGNLKVTIVPTVPLWRFGVTNWRQLPRMIHSRLSRLWGTSR